MSDSLPFDHVVGAFANPVRLGEDEQRSLSRRIDVFGVILYFRFPGAQPSRMKIMRITARQRRQLAAFLQRPDHGRDIIKIAHGSNVLVKVRREYQTVRSFAFQRHMRPSVI